jgi:hypothetical protein
MQRNFFFFPIRSFNSNSKIEKGSFVTVKIPIVDRASGDLPCEFGVLNACYDMGDIELLTHQIHMVDHQMPYQQ